MVKSHTLIEKRLKMKSNKKYIYNPNVANEIIQFGLPVLETGWNAKAQRVYFVFDYYGVTEFFHQRKTT